MYKSNESFLAESHGLAVGKAHGLRQGYDDGWNDAVAQVQGQLEAAKQENNDLAWGFNALLAIAAAALDTLDRGPEKLRHAVVMDYLGKVDAWRQSGHLRGIPHADPCVRRRTPETSAQMQRWVESAIAAASLKSGK